MMKEFLTLFSPDFFLMNDIAAVQIVQKEKRFLKSTVGYVLGERYCTKYYVKVILKNADKPIISKNIEHDSLAFWRSKVEDINEVMSYLKVM